MASSPTTPINSTLSNPKKRPSLSSHSTTEAKRQRVQAHPLRQASYPDPHANGFYAAQTPQSARSETGSIANSHVSGSATGSTTKIKRGRGRPRKSTQLDAEDIAAGQTGETGDLTNLRSGGVRGTKSVISRGRSEQPPDEEDDDEAEDYGGPLDEQDKVRIEEEKKDEAMRIDRLTGTFTAEQYARYNLWRASKLNKNTVRKIVNQTVSQSVAQAPLQAINIYSKFFVGEIVEKARDVQVEWAKRIDDKLLARKQALKDEIGDLEKKIHEARTQRTLQSSEETLVEIKREGDDTQLDQENKSSEMVKSHQAQISRLKRLLFEAEQAPNPHKGGLLPEHLREAVRRYKADGEGGGVGYDGLSHHLMGDHGSGTWRVGQGNGARRLFR